MAARARLDARTDAVHGVLLAREARGCGVGGGVVDAVLGWWSAGGGQGAACCEVSEGEVWGGEWAGVYGEVARRESLLRVWVDGRDGGGVDVGGGGGWGRGGA